MYENEKKKTFNPYDFSANNLKIYFTNNIVNQNCSY